MLMEMGESEKNSLVMMLHMFQGYYHEISISFQKRKKKMPHQFLNCSIFATMSVNVPNMRNM